MEINVDPCPIGIHHLIHENWYNCVLIVGSFINVCKHYCVDLEVIQVLKLHGLLLCDVGHDGIDNWKS